MGRRRRTTKSKWRANVHVTQMSEALKPAVVFVVDDDVSARTFICQTLQSAGIGTESFTSAEDFLARADLSKADCVVTDVQMDGMSGVELQERLAQASAGLPVIVITGFATTRVTVKAMQQGAVAFLQKPYAAEALLAAVHDALAQRAGARDRLARKAFLTALFAKLKPAELAVLELLAAGLTNKQIARELDLSVRTIEARRRRIFKALGVSSAPEAVSLHVEYKAL
jgi:FixJ family two-component response regulator